MSANTWLIWGLIGFLGLMDALGLRAEGLTLAPAALLPTLIPIGISALLAFIYTRIRPDKRIATMAHMIAIGFAFTAVTMVLSYLMVGLKQPLLDKQLIDLDRFLGFDWPAMYQAVAAHPGFHILLKLIYLSLVPQMIVLQLIFNFRSQFHRAWELQWLFIWVCLGCIFCSGLWPAAGAFSAFHLQLDEPYVREFAALRASTLKVIGDGGVQGVIQFPSLHTALAILYIYVARGQRFLFPFFLILNFLVILATPVIGGHHLSDVLGGAALALIVIGAARTFAKKPQNKNADLSAGA